MKNFFLVMALAIVPSFAFSQTPGFKTNTFSGAQPEKVASATAEEKKLGENIYKTASLMDYRSVNTKLNDLKAKRQTNLNNWYTSSGDLTKDGAANAELKTKNAKLDEQITQTQKISDSLYFLYVKDYLKYKRKNILSFGPVRSRAFFDILYNEDGKRFQALGNAGFSIGDQSGSVYSELLSGNLGLFRVSLGTMLSASNKNDEVEAKQQEAYQRLVNNGGNTILSFEYPLMYLHNSTNKYNLVSRMIAKGTADIPALGTKTEKWAGSGSIGIDLYGDASLDNDKLKIFFNLNGNSIIGTDEYKTNLGISEKRFTFGQLSVGLILFQNFKISVVTSTFSSEKSLENRNPVLGTQVLTR